jgi:hypothetical protein
MAVAAVEFAQRDYCEALDAARDERQEAAADRRAVVCRSAADPNSEPISSRRVDVVAEHRTKPSAIGCRASSEPGSASPAHTRRRCSSPMPRERPVARESAFGAWRRAPPARGGVPLACGGPPAGVLAGTTRPLARAWTTAAFKSRPRAISTGPLNALLRLHVPPIKVVVFDRPYSLEGMGGPDFPPGFPCPVVLTLPCPRTVPFAYGALTRSGGPSQGPSARNCSVHSGEDLVLLRHGRVTRPSHLREPKFPSTQLSG